jgi:hypothetical protein
MAMKTPAQAANNYGTNASSATSANLWAANYNADIPGHLDAAITALDRWQAAVADPAAKDMMNKGLTRAKNNVTAIANKVNGPGKNSFQAGTKAAASGNYLTFANQFMPAVANEVATLDRTNPRGTRADNRARQAAFDQWIDSQSGNFRVK